jgi:polysaccharide export outer membrane protein
VVLGAVANPGLIPIDRPYHLSEILARVGGVRENGADYVILRPEKGEQRRLSIQALATGDASQDPLVAPGDKIFSPKAEVFYISGQIKLPGAYPLSTDMTLRMAIARGGGLTETGSENRITITRHNVDLDRAALNGKIEPDDVIVVGQSFF